MRIAYFTPLNPMRSGISDHSEELLPRLGAHAEIDVMIRGDYEPSNRAITGAFRVLPFGEYLRDPSAYDAAVYQVGNNLAQHAYMVTCLRAAPGIVVLQDYCLQYLVCGLTLGRGDLRAAADALRPRYGDDAPRLARRLLFGLADAGELTFAHPILAASRAVVVHSRLALDLVRRDVPGKPAADIRMGVCAPASAPQGKERLRRMHGYGPEDFVVASVSTRAPRKRLDVVLRALGEIRERIPGLRCLVVGGGSPGSETHRLVRELGLSGMVRQTGWVESQRYEELIRLADVAVDLRETAGAETANSALRCLALGTPVIVPARGTFLELPDSCCPKVTPDARQAAALGALLIELARDPVRVKAMSDAALDHATRHLTMDGQARELAGFLTEVVRTTPGTGRVALLEPRGGAARPLVAAVYNACRVGLLVRRYGIADSLKRLQTGLASRA